MAKRPALFRPHGVGDRKAQTRQADRWRGSARDRGYDAAWERASKDHLAEHPLCAYCALRGGQITAATLVDHLYPQQVYAGVMWLRELWVSSCAPCHSSFKQAIEHRGRAALDTLARRLGRPTLAQLQAGG